MKTIECIHTDNLDIMVYGTALQRWGNLIKPPPVGSLSKWFNMLGELEIKWQKKNVKRAPYICLEAARLLHHHEDELRAALNMEPMRQTRAAVLTAAARVPPGFKEQMEKQMEEQMDELKERSSQLRAERDEFKAAWKQRGLEIEELKAQLATVTNELSVCKASTGRLVDDLEQRHQADLVSLNESIVKATLELERVRRPSP
jgi:flagellar biosynthesis/type III secretory pathway protein FliH